MSIPQPNVRLANGFDDPICNAERWDALLRRGETNVLFLARSWLKPWWEAYQSGILLLVVAEMDGEPIALAPLFSTEGMIFFLGAGESDYLDFIGDTSDPDTLARMLAVARDAVPGFLGFQFHLIPDRSANGKRMEQIAPGLGMNYLLERDLPAFEVDLLTQADAVRIATNRSMLKRETYFQQNGDFSVTRLVRISDILPNLEPFYQQHTKRWEGKDYDSPFKQAATCDWLRRTCLATADEDTLRVLRIDWKGQMLAISFSWHYRGVHYSGPWSFAIEHGKHCPGHVLLRHSLLWALDENLSTYDLRGGDDPYKNRLVTVQKSAQTHGLYPP